MPNGDDQNAYLVVDDFGRNGRAWREADVEATDLETVILDLLEGQYKNPVRVVGFNTAEGWSQDVSADVAHELRHWRSTRTGNCNPPVSLGRQGRAEVQEKTNL